jgi:hypothetical protein
MAYAMADLGWKFYFINAAWDFVFLIIAYFTFVETKGLRLEEINAKFEGKDFIEGVYEDTSSQDQDINVKAGGVVTETSKPGE